MKLFSFRNCILKNNFHFASFCVHLRSNIDWYMKITWCWIKWIWMKMKELCSLHDSEKFVMLDLSELPTLLKSRFVSLHINLSPPQTQIRMNIIKCTHMNYKRKQKYPWGMCNVGKQLFRINGMFSPHTLPGVPVITPPMLKNHPP